MLVPFEGLAPRLAPAVFLAPKGVVIGDGEIEAESSLWFGTVARGDVHRIRIGRRTNVQNGTYLHVTGGVRAGCATPPKRTSNAF